MRPDQKSNCRRFVDPLRNRLKFRPYTQPRMCPSRFSSVLSHPNLSIRAYIRLFAMHIGYPVAQRDSGRIIYCIRTHRCIRISLACWSLCNWIGRSSGLRQCSSFERKRRCIGRSMKCNWGEKRNHFWVWSINEAVNSCAHTCPNSNIFAFVPHGDRFVRSCSGQSILWYIWSQATCDDRFRDHAVSSPSCCTFLPL